MKNVNLKFRILNNSKVYLQMIDSYDNQNLHILALLPIFEYSRQRNRYLNIDLQELILLLYKRNLASPSDGWFDVKNVLHNMLNDWVNVGLLEVESDDTRAWLNENIYRGTTPNLKSEQITPKIIFNNMNDADGGRVNHGVKDPLEND